MLKLLVGRLARRPWRFLFPGLLLFFFALTLSRRRSHDASAATYYSRKTKSFFPPLKEKTSSIEPDFCQNFPKQLLEDVQVVLKVASGESTANKAHLSTVTRCISNLIIVGDQEQRIGERQVIDILAELPPSYAENNPNFETYLTHKKAHAEGESVNYAQQGWKLDRFKFLPMVDKAYMTSPKAKWFVFLEADVYFFWDTLFRLLDQLDHSESHYMGLPHKGSDSRYFAFGGAGFVMSQGLMKRLFPLKTGVTQIEQQNRLSVRYEEWVKQEQRGDAVLAYTILNATGVKLEGLHPTFASDELKSITVDKARWCVPLLSLHPISPEQMEKLWTWERTRPYNQKPFVYSSLLAYTHSHLRDGPSREFWDNLSEAPVPNDRPAHRNAGSCGDECSRDPNCLQWSYSQTVCRFASHIKLGNAVDRENGGQGEFTSGWDLGKMAAMGFKVDEESDINDTCMEATWLTPTVI